MKRTLLRNSGQPGTEDPFDDELARLIVAVVIADLAGQHPSVRAAARRRAESAAVSGPDVVALF